MDEKGSDDSSDETDSSDVGSDGVEDGELVDMWT